MPLPRMKSLLVVSKLIHGIEEPGSTELELAVSHGFFTIDIMFETQSVIQTRYSDEGEEIYNYIPIKTKTEEQRT